MILSPSPPVLHYFAICGKPILSNQLNFMRKINQHDNFASNTNLYYVKNEKTETHWQEINHLYSDLISTSRCKVFNLKQKFLF